MDAQTLDGVCVVAAPYLGHIVEHARVKTSAAAVAAFHQEVGMAGEYMLLHLIESQHIEMPDGSLAQAGIGGAVYVRITANATYPNAVVGGFEAASDTTNSVQLTNAQWAGTADANGIAELRILTMLNA